MDEIARLRKLSGILYGLALSLSVILPILVLVHAGKGVADPASLLSRAPLVPSGTPVSQLQAGLVGAVGILSVLPMVAALRGMARLFARYAEGVVLEADNAEIILRIGRALVVVALFAILVPAAQTLILGWNAADKVMALSLDGGTLGFLMAAGLLTVIGWALREAARIKTENEGFV
ncbi:MAG: DUF2975 domain-containing protein [Tabrizicola sp.]